MRYVAILMLMTGGLAWLSLGQVWPESVAGCVLMVVLVWLTLGFAACTVLYLGATGFGMESGRVTKRMDGRTRWGLSWFFLAPSAILSTLSLRLQRALSREPRLQPVDEGLYVGSHLFPGDRGRFERSGVTAVLDLCAELGESGFIRQLGPEKYLSVPVLDGLAPSVGQLCRLTGWVMARLDEQEKVMIHCALGHSRSAVAAACVLLRRGRVSSTDQAVTWLERRRPRIRLHQGQRRAVDAFAQAQAREGA